MKSLKNIVTLACLTASCALLANETEVLSDNTITTRSLVLSSQGSGNSNSEHALTLNAINQIDLSPQPRLNREQVINARKKETSIPSKNAQTSGLNVAKKKSRKLVKQLC